MQELLGSEIWVQLDAKAFRPLGAVTATVVLENLREACSSPTSTIRCSTRSIATCSRTTARSRCMSRPRCRGRAASAILVTIGHWDLYARLSVFDTTQEHTLFGAAGFVHRWGG
jgi:hypothetical protein